MLILLIASLSLCSLLLGWVARGFRDGRKLDLLVDRLDESASALEAAVNNNTKEQQK